MAISMIAAADRNNVIGKSGKMPWHLPADLAYFKEVTLGHTVVMGRKTYEAIGRALPLRKNIVLTSKHDFHATDCIVMQSEEEVLKYLYNTDEEVFIIGGGEVYRQFLPVAQRVYLTVLNEIFEGDTYFPTLQQSEWEVVSMHKGTKDDHNPYEHTFYIYERKSC